jgi:NADPH:quinone reductase-like Zn-dependent oxidoreductase
MIEPSMRLIEATAFDLGSLRFSERPTPRPRRGEILLRVKAATLNYRDLAVLSGTYIRNLPLPYVPASDACGEVVEIGEGVTRFRVGDRVLPTYTQGWHDGKPTPQQRSQMTLGAPLPGVLAEYLVVPELDAVAAPPSLSDVEAATLPIAGLTAWTALQEGGIKSGDTVLLIGTGGVSLFALQFAKAAGARTILLSSDDAKLARGRELGADIGINYRSHPDWDREVKPATDNRGADIIIETGGATLPRSLNAVAFGGFVAIVGFVAGYEATIQLRTLIGPMVRMQGIAVGSRASFEAMNRAIAANSLKPVIDSTFPLSEAAAAFRHMQDGGHFGKIGILL